MIFLYAGLLVALIVFRKAMIQVVSALVAFVFLFVTFLHWEDVLEGQLSLRDAFRQSGQVIFEIGPIQDVANMLIAGNYIAYLNRIDYTSDEINVLAIQKVARTGDDDLLKTKALLEFVSNGIYYVSDPNDGLEHAKDPMTTLLAGGGDCEDQALLLCSLLESVGVKTYIAFTDAHVFALVRFEYNYPKLNAVPHVYIGGKPCYAIDPADPGAVIGQSGATPLQIKRIFDSRRKLVAHFTLQPEG
jgi:transglutaminase-like putative cysteine protease